ncbi:MAG: DUF1289 domain-containing protein [Burkholderiaceae bacterium]|nr:DUF1289 domain-containing protein [Burkholderiaceae bacterium]
MSDAPRSARAPAAGREPAASAAPLSSAAPVPSPCISVCRIEPASGLCEGCQRTLDEIARWGSMSNEARREVWSAIHARRAGRGPGSDTAQDAAVAAAGGPAS